MQGNRALPLAVAFLYAIVGALWITFSDYLVIFFWSDNATTMTGVQASKGLGFIAVNALALYLLLRVVQRHQDKLRRSYLALLHEPTQFYWFADTQGRSFEVGKGFEHITSVAVDSLVEASWKAMIHPGDRDYYLAQRQHALETGLPYECEIRLQSRQGYRTLFMREQPIVDFKNRIALWVGSATDISEIRATEYQLARERLNIELAEDIGNVSLWEWNIRTQEASFSRHMSDQLGYAAGELAETMDAFVQLIHPDDLQKLWQEIQNISNGAAPESESTYRLRHKDGSYRWILSRVRGNQDAEGNTISLLGANIDITSQKQAEEKLSYLVDHDELTGIHNRRYFQQALQNAVSQAQTDQAQISLLIISLDQQPRLSGTTTTPELRRYYNMVGDKIRSQLHSTDCFCHLDSEQFAVILSHQKPGRQNLGHQNHSINVEQIAKSIIDDFRRALDIGSQKVFVDVTIGSSIFPKDATTSEKLLRCAQVAWQQARKAESHCYLAFNDSLQRAVDARRQYKNIVQEAIVNQAFDLSFLPRKNLETGEIVCLNIDFLWHSELLRQANADELLSIIRESGLQPSLDKAQLDTCMATLLDWSIMGFEPKIALPVSTPSLHSDDFAVSLVRQLQRDNIAAGRVELRIEEPTVWRSDAMTSAVIRQLARHGIPITLSGLCITLADIDGLESLRANSLEIDARFADDPDMTNPRSLIFKTLLALAKALELDVVASGVRTEEQITALKNHGCRFAQGPAISEAMCADDTRFALTHSD